MDRPRNASDFVRGNPVGHEALSHYRPIADTETSTISRVETQTEATPIRKCERFWTQPTSDIRKAVAVLLAPFPPPRAQALANRPSVDPRWTPKTGQYV